jgi:hypothetical protein
MIILDVALGGAKMEKLMYKIKNVLIPIIILLVMASTLCIENINLKFSILGLIGGLLCCIGDILFDLKGKGNKKLGTSKNIDSNWSNMAEWRFKLSILCALVGVIFLGFCFYSIADMIKDTNLMLSNILLITGFIGCIGGFFVHSILCIQAIIYKRITNNGKSNFKIADNTLEGLYKAIMFPFILIYCILMIADICVAVAVLSGDLSVPKWMALLNSIVFLIIGILFRKINPDKFQDLPGIIMPSLGLAMVGVIGIVASII